MHNKSVDTIAGVKLPLGVVATYIVDGDPKLFTIYTGPVSDGRCVGSVYVNAPSGRTYVLGENDVDWWSFGTVDEAIRNMLAAYEAGDGRDAGPGTEDGS